MPRGPCHGRLPIVRVAVSRESVLAFAVTLAVLGSDVPVDLHWSGVCADTSAVLPNLEVELAETDRAYWVPVQATVVAHDEAPGLAATVELSTSSGQTRRVLRAETCDALHQAVTLMLALHVDPYGGDPPPESSAEPPPEPSPEPELHVPEPVEAQPRPTPASVVAPQPVTPKLADERDPDRVIVRAGVGVAAGLLPRVAPAFELAGAWTRGRWEIGGRVTYQPSQRRDLEVGQVTLQAWDGAAQGCAVFHPGPLVLPLCANVGAGAVHGRANGFGGAGADVRPQAYASGSVGAGWAIAPGTRFWARAEAGATLARPRFEVGGLGRVYTAPVWRAGLVLGVSFDFFVTD